MTVPSGSCWSTTTRWSGPVWPSCSTGAGDIEVVGQAGDGAEALEVVGGPGRRSW